MEYSALLQIAKELEETQPECFIIIYENSHVEFRLENKTYRIEDEPYLYESYITYNIKLQQKEKLLTINEVKIEKRDKEEVKSTLHISKHFLDCDKIAHIIIP